MATKPTYTEPEAYKSQYSDQIASGIDKVTNREAFSYDPLKDANYQAMAKIYTQQGNKAAKDTLGDAASLNGGYGSSYAVTASQQVRNDYNQQLASQIPTLQQAAYDRYKDSYDMDMSALQLMQDADNTAYGRHRDDVTDSQWKYGEDYQAYRDDVADTQWQTEYDRSVYESDRDYERDVYESDRDYKRDVYESDREHNYQKDRDEIEDEQWAKEYALSKKTTTSSSGSSSGGYIGSSASSTSSNYSKAKSTASKKTASKSTTKGHHTSKISKKSTTNSKKTASKKTTSKSTTTTKGHHTSKISKKK